MKKIIALILALVMILGVAACSFTPKEKIIKVGIAAPDVTTDWIAGVGYYAEKYCKTNNLDYMITVSSDASEMASNLEKLVEEGCTVIVSWHQWTGMEKAFQKVIDRGIPVVNFDIDVECEGSYKVTGDHYGVGYHCAEYITGVVEDGANIAVMDVSSGSICELRKQGFYDYLEQKGYDTSNIFEVNVESFAREEGQAAMAEVLERYPQIDAVFSMDDETSIGCIAAIKDAGRKDIKAITGGGGSQEYFRMIADESYASLSLATALYSPSMVIEAIKTAVTLLEGGEVEPVVVIPTTIVTAENVAQFLDENNTVY
ncbi:MAG: substrate-binding domain-containing protein [Oscillospiraceae bacterium]|nr:substrate-binding domain-containing protein [Oscillospiraceae bacterium]